MSHYRSLDNLSLQTSWLTVGVFDGLHRGHRALTDVLVSGAHAGSLPAVVLTFTPHPAVVLGGKTDFKCLSTPEERAELLFEQGVDIVITQHFDLALAAQTAEEFMNRVARSLGLRRLIIGYDFALGRDRLGNAARLAEIGKDLGYTVQVIPPLATEEGVISSTRIRRAIARGEVESAAVDLGRWYAVRGPVIHGDGRGRRINMPTANIAVPEGKLIPANGVYACWAWVDDEKHAAVANVGIRPTFTTGFSSPSVETHLLDFNRNLYGQEIQLEFVSRLREERKFPSVEALVAQIHTDIMRAQEFLGTTGGK